MDLIKIRAARAGLSPSFTVGWRFQKPNKHLMIRAGLSWPETLYVGIGIPF